MCDLAIALGWALGGDCLADIATLRAEPGVFGLIASDPTMSRLINTLAQDADTALRAIDTARARARASTWKLAGEDAPDHGVDADHPLVIDLDASLLDAHSDKENAAPTFKRGYGFHPLCSFVDHGEQGTGEPLAIMLRPGNAGSNTAADHITVTRDALRQLPFTAKGGRIGRKVLIRTDGAGGTHDFVDWLAACVANSSTEYSSSTPVTYATSSPSTKPISIPIDHTDPSLRPHRYDRWTTPKPATSRSSDMTDSAE